MQMFKINKARNWIKENKWLILIIILGAFLRIFYLGHESFWVDESETVFGTHQSASIIIKNIYTKILGYEYFLYTKGGTMPLYYLLAYYWTKLGGLSEFNLRIFSSLFGIISIYLIYLLGKEFFSKRVGLIAAFILSINHQHIYYSQEARAYSFLVVLAMLSVYSFYKLLIAGRIYYLILYSLSTALMLYTHYYSFFILLFQGIYFLILFRTYKDKIKKLLLSWVMAFLLYIPWLGPFIRQFSGSSGINIIHGQITFTKIAILFTSINSGISLDFQTRYSLVNSQYMNITILGALTIASVLLISILFFYLFLRQIFKFLQNHKHLFLVLWFVIPILVPFIITIIFPASSAFGPVRYVLFATPAYYILIAKSITEFKKFNNLILILILVLSIMPLYSYYANYDKGQYREAAEYLASKAKEDDFVIVHGAPVFLPFNYYYSKYSQKASIYRSFSIDELKQSVNSKNEFWAVLSMLKHYDPRNEFVKFADKNFTVEEQKEFIDVKVVKYKRKNG